MKMKEFSQMLETNKPEVLRAVAEWLQTLVKDAKQPAEIECPYCTKHFPL